MTLDLADRRERIIPLREAVEHDPLLVWRFAVPRLRQAFSLFTDHEPIDELHARGPNKGTKTESIAAFVTRCTQKFKELDGVPLPQWRGKVEAAQLVLDYKQQLLSVQPAYLRLLGKWPHHAKYVGEYLSTLYIKPLGASDDESEWSVLHFLSQENKRSGVGVRADIVAFDEPPVMDILRELRKAAHAHRRSITIIGETPTIRRQWAPLREDYGDTPRRSIRRDGWRAEVRWSLDEVADWVLSAADKAKLLDKYKTDPLERTDSKARSHGDYTNTEGTCPFDAETLMQMLGECVDPEIEDWRVSIESMDLERTNTVTRVPVEIYSKPRKGYQYYIPVDPASGIEGGHEAGLHVCEMGSGDLCARWGGSIAPYSLGVLAAGLARQYNGAAIDIEMKDHWGVNVVRGVQASEYGNLCNEMRELRPGVFAKEVGFDNDEEVKAIIIGQIQEWVEAWRSGVKYARCPSRAAINCLLDAELDERQIIVAGPGVAHGWDMILKGQSLRRAVSRSTRDVPDIYHPPKTEMQRLASLIHGADDDDEPHQNGHSRVSIQRPRM